MKNRRVLTIWWFNSNSSVEISRVLFREKIHVTFQYLTHIKDTFLWFISRIVSKFHRITLIKSYGSLPFVDHTRIREHFVFNFNDSPILVLSITQSMILLVSELNELSYSFY